jgi:carboxypeptidase C (cathepsin A)
VTPRIGKPNCSVSARWLRFLACACCAAIVLAVPPSALAVSPASDAPSKQVAAKPDQDLEAFPAPKSIHQSAVIDGRRVDYQATVGSIAIKDDDGKLLGEVVYTAFTVPSRNPSRPVTFAFNGGPGAASAYLDLGVLGPKRAVFGGENDYPSSSPGLRDNPDSWLDFTDLVFIDPIGTGYSRTRVDEEQTKKAFLTSKSDMVELPSMAAGYLERQGKPLNEQTMAPIELYTRTEFVADLFAGPADKAATDRLSTKVAELTGLDPVLVRQLNGRIDLGTFLRESRRAEGKVGSGYDSNVTTYDPFPAQVQPNYDDPIFTRATAAFVSGMTDFIVNQVGWKVDARYYLNNFDLNRKFDRDDHDGPAAALRKAIAIDPMMTATIANGYNDFACPYFMSKLILAQMPAYGVVNRVKLHVYAGGHMFYSRPQSAQSFRRDMKETYESTPREGAGT